MTPNTWRLRFAVPARPAVRLESRAFSIAITACAAKFSSRAICLSENARTSCR